MNVRKVAVSVITDCLNQEVYSNLKLSQVISEGLVKPIDVPLLTELVYGTITYKMTLDYYLADFIRERKIPNYLRNILRLAVYQMKYLDKIPSHAIINEAVELTKERYKQQDANFVNAVLRNILRQGTKKVETIEDPLERLSIETSHPLWLVKMWSKQYGFEVAEKLCRINNTKPLQFARLNFTKGEKAAVLAALKDIPYHEVPGIPEAIYFTENNIAHSQAFKAGYLTIQDLSSMLVGIVLDPKAGEQILDTCSAPGGKATHMAERMQNQGRVVACDIHEHKLGLIKQNAKRLGLSIVEPQLCDATKLTETFKPQSFDRVLVDAPCSGFGVIRRKPEIKYNKTPEDLDQILTLQKAIIKEAMTMVKPGGRLVYSTCTINKKENEKMVEYILQSDHFELEPKPFMALGLGEQGYCQIIDQFPGADVFFIACFTRKE